MSNCILRCLIVVAVGFQFGCFAECVVAQGTPIRTFVDDVQDFKKDYFWDKPFQYSPADPFERGKVFRMHTGHWGKFYNCDGEEAKRNSPYICWKIHDEPDFPQRKNLRTFLSCELAEVKQRIMDGVAVCGGGCDCGGCSSGGTCSGGSCSGTRTGICSQTKRPVASCKCSSCLNLASRLRRPVNRLALGSRSGCRDGSCSPTIRNSELNCSNPAATAVSETIAGLIVDERAPQNVMPVGSQIDVPVEVQPNFEIAPTQFQKSAPANPGLGLIKGNYGSNNEELNRLREAVNETGDAEKSVLVRVAQFQKAKSQSVASTQGTQATDRQPPTRIAANPQHRRSMLPGTVPACTCEDCKKR